MEGHLLHFQCFDATHNDAINMPTCIYLNLQRFYFYGIDYQEWDCGIKAYIFLKFW